MSNWSKKFITENEIAKVSAAVHKAEQNTSGEIVPMIVQRSCAIGHVPVQILLLWIILLFAIFVGAEHWWHNWASPLWFLIGGVLFAPAVLQLSKLNCVQRILTSDVDEKLQVFNRAQLEFSKLRIQHTKARTGILIFLSIMEHQCVVLADEGIAKKLPPETWQNIVNKVIGGIKNGKPGDGLIAAIEDCSKLLATHFPIGPTDKNELGNSLVIKE